MTDAELMGRFVLSLAVAAVIVLAAAALLIGIWLAARRILHAAVRALTAVQAIKANTQSIWALKETNTKATRILGAAESIRDHGALVAGALDQERDENVA